MTDYNLKNIRKEYQKKGIFHTPKETALYLKSFIDVDIDIDEVYDPTCGTGGLLSVFDDNVKKYGQELSVEQLEIARNNLVNFYGICGDTLESHAFIDKKFKCIVANPPFSLSWNPPNLNDIFNHKMWHGLPAMPPKSRADYAFIIHILHCLKEDGIALVINHPGVLYRMNKEYEIRKYIVNENLIEKIVKIPSGSFVDTNIETVLIIFRKNKKNTDIEFIDKEINKSVIVNLDKIKDNDYNLAISNYCFETFVQYNICPFTLQEKARSSMINKILKDLEFDAMVCKIESWNHIEYCEKLINAITKYKINL
jgi:type I restriction-modification system DNA methylase subunit